MTAMSAQGTLDKSSMVTIHLSQSWTIGYGQLQWMYTWVHICRKKFIWRIIQSNQVWRHRQ